jgi:hypothetical protein
MTTIHHSSIYGDLDDQAPPSPSEAYEGDTSFHSEMSIPGTDEIIASIETTDEAMDEPEPYISSYTSRPSNFSASSQSRRVSAITSTSFISSLPSEISVSSKPALQANNLDSRYTPRKERPPFRNPASVRAMQMSSPPPLPAYDASGERLKGNYKLATPSRATRSDTVSTTGSRRSRAQRDSVHSEYQMHQSPRATPTPQQSLPLVLLHVTILPIQLPYSHDFMIKAMPEWLVENYRVLKDKLQDIVLMNRGILISHPRDEYDVLEERILESLELKTPRLLKCGHFLGPDADADDDEIEEDDGSVTDGGMGRGSRMSGGTIMAEDEAEWNYPTPESEDSSVCTDCCRQVQRPGRGVGVGTKRWEIKIYAANGLMRAGAWSAAWSEMERCDVEISPWIPDDMRKALDKRMQEEQEAVRRKQMYAAELARQIAEEAATQKKLEDEAEAKRRAEEMDTKRRIELEAIVLQQKLEQEAEEKRRLEETLDEKIEEAKETIRLEFEAQALAEANSIAERLRAMEEALRREQEKAATQAPADVSIPQHHRRSYSQGRPRSISRRPMAHEIPIGTLLKNYVLLQLRDSRNYLIVILGALVVFLATNADHSWSLTTAEWGTTPGNALGPVIDAMPSIVVTSTATTTATSVVTVFATESQPSERGYETSLFSFSTSITDDAIIETSIPSRDVPVPSLEEVDELLGSAIPEEASMAVVVSDAPDSSPSMPIPTVSEEAPTSTSPALASENLDETDSMPSETELENALYESALPEPTSSATESLATELMQEPQISDIHESSEAPIETVDKDEL